MLHKPVHYAGKMLSILCIGTAAALEALLFLLYTCLSFLYFTIAVAILALPFKYFAGWDVHYSNGAVIGIFMYVLIRNLYRAWMDAMKWNAKRAEDAKKWNEDAPDYEPNFASRVLIYLLKWVGVISAHAMNPGIETRKPRFN